MVTVDDLSPGSSLPGPIEISVTNVNWKVGGRRAVVDAVDSVGTPIRLIDFSGADIGVEWREDQAYRISECDVKRGSGGYDLQLEPSGRTEIDPVEAAAEHLKLLVIGDTHVGYRHRSSSEKNKWSRRVDCREIFSQCVHRARSHGVDAMVHAGDVFDHGNTKRDRDFVTDEINSLAENGIPFYYILGNHDDESGRNVLTSSSAIRLTDTPTPIDGGALNLIGIDHAGHRFPTDPPELTVDLLLQPTLLVTHEKPYPVLNARGNLIYNRAANVAEISGYLSNAPFGIDYILSGHQHLSRTGTVKEFDTDVLVTGSPAQLRKPIEDNPFSTWLLTLDDGHFELTRQPI